MVNKMAYSMQQLQKEVKELKKEIEVMQELMFVPKLRALKSKAIKLQGALKGAKIDEKDFKDAKHLLFKQINMDSTKAIVGMAMVLIS